LQAEGGEKDVAALAQKMRSIWEAVTAKSLEREEGGEVGPKLGSAIGVAVGGTALSAG